jgi:hypothetical protein
VTNSVGAPGALARQKLDHHSVLSKPGLQHEWLKEQFALWKPY